MKAWKSVLERSRALVQWFSITLILLLPLRTNGGELWSPSRGRETPIRPRQREVIAGAQAFSHLTQKEAKNAAMVVGNGWSYINERVPQLTATGDANALLYPSQTATKKIVFAESRAQLNWDTLIPKDSILIRGSSVTNREAKCTAGRASILTPRFCEITNRFALDFNVDLYRKIQPNKTLFITSAKKSNGETLVTAFKPSLGESDPLVGELRPLGRDPSAARRSIEDEFTSIGKGRDVLLYGDDLEATHWNAAASAAGVNLLRRSSLVQKDLVNASIRITQLGDRPMAADNTVLLNAIPHDIDNLKAMGFPSSGAATWAAFHAGVERAMENRYTDRITSKTALFDELSNGKKDIVIIIAHNDGRSFYFNGERVTFDELSNLPDREPPSMSPRLAIVISCAAGTISNDNRFLASLASSKPSFGELLIKKGFFDEVIAPSREVGHTEVLKFLESIPQGSSMIRNFPPDGVTGWIKLGRYFRGVGTMSV